MTNSPHKISATDSSPLKAYGKRTPSDNMLHILFGSLSKSIRILFIIYIIVSLVYTFAHFFTLFHPAALPLAVSDSGNQQLSSTGKEQTIVGKIVLDNSQSKSSAMWTGRFSLVSAQDSGNSGDLIRFIDIFIDKSMERTADSWTKSIPEDLFYSKLFQYSLQPSKVIPYFFKMDPPPNSNDITITTMITAERLTVLSGLVKKFHGKRLFTEMAGEYIYFLKGPVSVTFHLPDDERKLAIIEQLHEIYRDNQFFSRYVDMHLVIDKFDRQFNLWRNIARMFARTDLIMTMDVDFMLCSDLSSNFALLSAESKEMVRNGTGVFVVPAFEMPKEAPELSVDDYPSTKAEVLKLIERKNLIMFHEKWQRGHGPTNYLRWYQSSEPYRITEYNYNYEPYVLMRRTGLPW